VTRVLVTGSKGFVGSHVSRCFEEHGATVVGIDIDDPFPVHPVDTIVSLAATADPRSALQDPADAYANGTRVMVETLEYARLCGARVLHVSTNEAHPPVGPYGGAKACQEVVCETYPDVAPTIVVTQSLFGERQQRDKLVPTAIRSILNGDPVKLQSNGNGGFATRPFLHARNLAQALVWIASHKAPQRVNVGATETLSVRDVVAALAGALGQVAKIEPVPAGGRPGHEAHAEPIGCDLERWQPLYGTIPALRDVARWYVNNPEWL
jgi:nucleoside-diphosphate-sugar epimerase